MHSYVEIWIVGVNQQLISLVLDEFGSPVLPMTPEALALHFIDDLDSKINQLRGAVDRGGGMQFLRGFGRYLLLPEEPDAAEADDDDPDPQAHLEL